MKTLYYIKKNKNLKNLVKKIFKKKKDTLINFIDLFESRLLYYLYRSWVLNRSNNKKHVAFMKYYGFLVNGKRIKNINYLIKINDILTLPKYYKLKEYQGNLVFKKFKSINHQEINKNTLSIIKFRKKNKNQINSRFQSKKKMMLFKNILNINLI